MNVFMCRGENFTMCALPFLNLVTMLCVRCKRFAQRAHASALMLSSSMRRWKKLLSFMAWHCSVPEGVVMLMWIFPRSVSASVNVNCSVCSLCWAVAWCRAFSMPASCRCARFSFCSWLRRRAMYFWGLLLSVSILSSAARYSVYLSMRARRVCFFAWRAATKAIGVVVVMVLFFLFLSCTVVAVWVYFTVFFSVVKCFFQKSLYFFGGGGRMVVHSGVVPGLLFLSWAGCGCTPLFLVCVCVSGMLYNFACGCLCVVVYCVWSLTGAQLPKIMQGFMPCV